MSLFFAVPTVSDLFRKRRHDDELAESSQSMIKREYPDTYADDEAQSSGEDMEEKFQARHEMSGIASGYILYWYTLVGEGTSCLLIYELCNKHLFAF